MKPATVSRIQVLDVWRGGKQTRHGMVIEMTVDWDKLAAHFAHKLARSKNGRSVIQGGAIVARTTKHEKIDRC